MKAKLINFISPTGNDIMNQIIVVLLSVSMFVGGMTGFVLDNLLPGTREERGIVAWNARGGGEEEGAQRIASVHVYDPPFLTAKFMSSKVCKYIPFLPYYPPTELNSQPSGTTEAPPAYEDSNGNGYGARGV